MTYVLCDYASDPSTTILTQQTPKFLIMLSSVVSRVSCCFASGKGDDLYHFLFTTNSQAQVFRTAERVPPSFAIPNRFIPSSTASQQLVCKKCSQDKTLLAEIYVLASSTCQGAQSRGYAQAGNSLWIWLKPPTCEISDLNSNTAIKKTHAKKPKLYIQK